MHPPPLTTLKQNNTHRLIPSRYAEEGVLSELTDSARELDLLYELDGATNQRLIAESGRAPGISLHELVFGIPHANIINAAFCHPRPTGGRFNSSTRGAWYAGFERTTSVKEVTYHLGVWLNEVHWRPEDWDTPQVFSYAEFLADFRGDFHDLREKQKTFRDCLENDYASPQALAAKLLSEGSLGIVYPSVRCKGTCIACFRPAMVTNVRRGLTTEFTYASPIGGPKVKVA